MDGKERILKMLEEGQISTKEAIDLMNALNFETEDETDKKEDAGHHNNDGLFKFFEDMTDEVGKYLDPETIQDNVSKTYEDVKQRVSSQKQMSQAFNSFERVFDSVKNSNIDAIFQQGSKNRLIETIEQDFNAVSLDVTNGNVVVKPTDGATVARFEVTPFYRKLDKKRNYFQDIICEVKEDTLVVMSPLRSARVNVEVEINKETLKRLIVSSSNGDVSVKGLEVKDLSIDILNGNITTQAFKTNSAFIRASRGELQVEDSTFKNLELITMLGPIHTKDLDVEAIDISANGSVALQLNENTRQAEVNTNMGSINIEVPQGRKVEGRLQTVMGQINYPPGFKTRDMKPSDLGLKEVMILNDTDEAGLIVEASTKIGSIILHTV